jgi:hypothetical protein
MSAPIDVIGSDAGDQPYLHDKVVLVVAPTFAVLGKSGAFEGSAAGFFDEDRRLLARLDCTVRGARVVPIHAWFRGHERAEFRAVVRGIGGSGADSTIALTRTVTLSPRHCTVGVEVTNSGRQPAAVTIDLVLGTDLASIDEVKSGSPTTSVVPEPNGDGLAWNARGLRVEVHADPPSDEVDAPAGRVTYSVVIPPDASWSATLSVESAGLETPLFVHPEGPSPWPTVEVTGHRDLSSLVAVSLGDLDGLLLADPSTGDLFVGAGAPWFCTLFGRDALWSALMLLPVSLEVARGTLRALALRQGHRRDPESSEAPGKILHELRRADSRLPPRYYGTVDATPLWLVLLFEAWRWGLDPAEVEAMLDPAVAALCWLRDDGDADGDGFLDYFDTSSRGLANQGWRDSYDAVRWQDGRLAAAPIAPCEVQGYAYRAAMAGADLLDAFGRGGADEWRAWAERLRRRFAAAFWVDGPLGPYPAMGLDRDRAPVDAITSSMGHLLGTGILDSGEERAVAIYLGSPELDCGHGVRTLSARAVGFNPLGYHTGSVWPHDTIIAARGLASGGFATESRALIDGILCAAAEFEFRLPELFAGYGRAAGPPVPYPASCRPQAWAAAGSVEIVRTLVGLVPDVPTGSVAVTPLSGNPVPFGVRGLRVAGRPIDIDVDAQGRPSVTTTAPLRVR